MWSRREVHQRLVSLAASPFPARAQTSARDAAAGPTILQLQRRTIEVNGKTASSTASASRTAQYGLTTEVGKPFRVRVENGSTSRA